MNDLQANTTPLYGNLTNTITGLRTSAATALSAGSALGLSEGEARYEAAKAAGADYVEIDGEKVLLPVNTVLRRQFDITKRRYQAALDDSKRLSYIARLAMEQRIGHRLTQMAEPVGPLPAPSTWAEDICNLQGVNFEALKEREEGIDDETEKTVVIDDFVKNQYVGDYIAKLKSFIEFYNITYPFREADDVTVLSVRDDLLGPQGRCFDESRNELLYSGTLESNSISDESIEGATAPPRGWLRGQCEFGSTKCQLVHAGETLPAAIPDPPGISGGFTWLHDVNASDLVSVSDAIGPAPGPGEPRPPSGSVYQEVELEAGKSFVLSWWDMARGLAGETAPTTPSLYRAAIYGSDWEPLAVHVDVAFSGNGTTWGERRTLTFTTQNTGKYRIAFNASVDGPERGSVLIANVQLEESSSVALSATEYQHTGGSRLVVTGDCVAGSAAGFRSAFNYRCDETGACFYELTQPIVLDMRSLVPGKSKLVGKLGADNYNHRHIHLGTNIVGTGVIDCSKDPTPSCFGSGYLEYTFEHDAFDVPITDYLGAPHFFNFGSAGIRRAKALAAERFITLPVGSADLGLLSQAQIQKPEFMGRPLSGSYRLRVFDTPRLAWDRVEDVQLVLTYRYWSKISRESTQK